LFLEVGYESRRRRRRFNGAWRMEVKKEEGGQYSIGLSFLHQVEKIEIFIPHRQKCCF
jgi:hypothetical protein